MTQDLSTFQPRNYRINNVTFNWPKLAQPVNPFGTEQYELQIETTDKTLADELKANHFNVKVNEANKSFTVSLKRKAKRADGSSNDAPKVYNADATIMSDVAKIGNGSTGNVIVYQRYYKTAGREGIANSLTSIQVTDLKEYTGNSDSMFEAVTNIDAAPQAEMPFEEAATANPF